MAAPLLVVTDGTSRNRFSSYVAEILDVEGIMCRDDFDLSDTRLTEGVIASRETIILADIAPTPQVEGMLRRHVHAGGNLVALRPPRSMGDLFGLEPYVGVNTVLSDGYLEIDRLHPLGRGTAADLVQFKGAADLWLCSPEVAVATLSADSFTPTPFPAVVAGERGGSRCAAFTYDLAASTVLLHQGSRERASTGSAADPARDRRWIPNNLFIGELDPRQKLVPQADVQQDLLVRILNWTAERRSPLPRIWHFPDAAPAVAFINGDSDEMVREDLVNVVSTVERHGGKYTIYLMKEHAEKVIDHELEEELRGNGHSFGQHIVLEWMIDEREAHDRVAEELAYFRQRFGAAPLTNRGHCLIWPGWTGMASALAAGGVRIDQNFLPRNRFRCGYLNGSALPVKFMDEEGRLIDLYEQNTQIDDDGSNPDNRLKFLVPPSDTEEVRKLAIRMIEDCARRYHGVFQASFHPAQTSRHAMWLLNAVVNRCRELKMPMLGGDEWARFNDVRRGVRIQDLSYGEATGSLTFGVSSRTTVQGLTLILPGRNRNLLCRSAWIDGAEYLLERHTWEGNLMCLLVLDLPSERVREIRIQYGIAPGTPRTRQLRSNTAQGTGCRGAPAGLHRRKRRSARRKP